MVSNNIVKNAYKGLLYNMFLDLRKTILVGVITALSLAVFDVIMALIFININEYSSNDGSGSLFTGAIIMLFALIIHIVTSKDSIQSKFAFPINRSIYAVANVLFLAVGSFVLLASITIVAPFEVLILSFIDLISEKMVYVNPITLNSYMLGFISSWGYLLAFGSVTYCLFMYVRQYVIYSVPVITIIITSVFLFGWFGDIINFLFMEDNLLILIGKLLVITIISHLLGFIPLKRMEVS